MSETVYVFWSLLKMLLHATYICTNKISCERLMRNYYHWLLWDRPGWNQELKRYVPFIIYSIFWTFKEKLVSTLFRNKLETLISYTRNDNKVNLTIIWWNMLIISRNGSSMRDIKLLSTRKQSICILILFSVWPCFIIPIFVS